MPLINCKVELKLKWTKYCILSATGNDNGNDNTNNITRIYIYIYIYIHILFTKTQNYMLQSSLYQQMIIKNYQNFLAKDFKNQFIGVNIKQKV